MSRHSIRRIIVALLAALALPGCALFQNVEDRLLSIDYYHVSFKPSQTAENDAALRSAEAIAWRTQIRVAAQDVASKVSASNVYGDGTAVRPGLMPFSWDSIFTAGNSTVTQCRAKNTDSKSLKVTPLQGLLNPARIISAPGDLSHVDISALVPCTVPEVGVPNRRLLSLDIAAPALTPGVPQSNFDTFEVRVVNSNPTNPPWEPLDFATITATFDPGPVKGAAQFAFVVALQQQAGWENTFEEVIIVPRGSYFGDVKLPGP